MFALYIILSVLFAIFVVSFGRPFFRGAPFAPTDKRALGTMLELAQVKAGERTIDIGSGDGRLVIALARAGAVATGCEINLLLVWWSRWKLRTAGLKGKATIERKNLWDTDFSSYDVVTLFGITYIMKGLEKKLLAELKPGSRVICNNYRFPDWKPTREKNNIYVYVR